MAAIRAQLTGLYQREKGNKSFLGYKGYYAVDAEDGYIEIVSVAPPNESEVNMLDAVVDQITDARVILGFIWHKASRNRPLQTWHKRFNALVAKVRYKVEHS